MRAGKLVDRREGEVESSPSLTDALEPVLPDQEVLEELG